MKKFAHLYIQFMKKTINSDLIRGNINTIILKALYEGDRYGFDIVKEIEQKSSGQYVLKQPTLYSCLKRLENQGLIRSYWGAKSIGGRRKYYTLTDSGRELFVSYQTEWEYSRTVIDKLISDREYDLSRLDAIEPPLETEVVDLENNEDLESAETEEILLDNADTNENQNELEVSDNDETEEVIDDAEYAWQDLQEEETLDTATDEIIAEDNNNDDNQNSDSPAIVQQFICPLFTNHNLGENAQTCSCNDATASTLEIEKTASSFSMPISDRDGNSYIEGLENEEYTATPQKAPPVFEPNFSEDLLPIDDYEDISKYDIIEETCDAKELPPVEQEKHSSFINYHTRVSYDDDENQAILERDYKGVLARLIANQTTTVDEAKPAPHTPAYIPVSKEMQELEDKNELPPPTPTVNTTTTTTTTTDVYRELSYLGDDLTIRAHSTETTKEHSEKYYYYSNRLMLVHYGIMFAIMLFMVALTFLISFVASGNPMRIGVPRHPRFDIFLYIVGVVIAIIPPVIAVILCARNPDKEKRIQYRFRNALKYRLVLFVNILILTYLINVYLGMELSMRNGQYFLASLLMPALLALCLPISACVFYALYKSGKYAVK